MTGPEQTWRTNSRSVDTSTAVDTSPTRNTQVVELFHEVGPQFENYTAERLFDIDPSSPPRILRVKSHIFTSGAKALKSPQYLATIRRRETSKISDLIAGLEAHAGSEDFAVWTHEPLEKIRRMIQKLTEAEQHSDPEHEGNSCEILRQLRDTFLDNGWKRYREPSVRDLAVEVLRHMSVADEISSEDAYRAMDQFLDAGLDPSAGMVWKHDEEKTEVLD